MSESMAGRDSQPSNLSKVELSLFLQPLEIVKQRPLGKIRS